MSEEEEGVQVSEVRGKMKNGFKKKSVQMKAEHLTFWFLKHMDILVACT